MVNLLFVPKAEINLLGRDLMSKLGIEIKVREKNFKISLNLMTVKIEDQILPEVWIGDGNRGGLHIPPIHIGLKVRQYEGNDTLYPWKGDLAWNP
jgi:hypothetical protein